MFRFARADVPANCTITSVKTGWIHNSDGSKRWEYKLEVNPLSELLVITTTHHVENKLIRGKWQACIENKIQRAQELGIINQPDQFSEFEDGFPHRNLPIFARNKKIRQDLNTRERKRRIKAE